MSSNMGAGILPDVAWIASRPRIVITAVICVNDSRVTSGDGTATT